MAHRRGLAEHLEVTQMPATLQKIYYWQQMAADVTSAVQKLRALHEKSVMFAQAS